MDYSGRKSGGLRGHLPVLFLILLTVHIMGDVMGPLSYPPWREGETLPPYPPPLQILPPPLRERGPGGTPNRLIMVVY